MSVARTSPMAVLGLALVVARARAEAKLMRLATLVLERGAALQ